MKISERIKELEQIHGGLRAAARSVGLDPGYLCRLKNERKMNPSDEVLKKLGLKKELNYVLDEK